MLYTITYTGIKIKKYNVYPVTMERAQAITLALQLSDQLEINPGNDPSFPRQGPHPLSYKTIIMPRMHCNGV